MANQQNYKTDTQQASQQATRYMVSRVIADKSDDLLSLEVPADFTPELTENIVEVNLYSLADNSLIYSDFIRNSDALTTRTLQYNDGTFRRLLFIDFAKVTQAIFLPSGKYSVTLNFFADELGSYDDKILKISKISTSRKEVELKLTDASRQRQLEQFAIPQIPVKYIKDVLIQIFNQNGSDQISLPASPAKIDSTSVYSNFGNNYGQQLIRYGFDQDAENGQRPGINTLIQKVLDIAYPLAVAEITKQLIENPTSISFTQTELSKYVVDAIDIAYDQIISDEEQNPSKYRFDLI